MPQAGVHEKGNFSFLELMERVKSTPNFEMAGAIALFIGVVRGETSKGEKVKKLTLEAYEEKANEMLVDICDNLKKKEGIIDVQIHHLLGEFNAGEDLVYVLVAGAHRENVFPVLEEAVETYKKVVPIFKKEQVIDEQGETSAYWVSEPGTSTKN